MMIWIFVADPEGAACRRTDDVSDVENQAHVWEWVFFFLHVEICGITLSFPFPPRRDEPIFRYPEVLLL